MSGLRRNCERLIRLYPAVYREDRGEEIVETLIEVTRPGRTLPPVGEMAALAAHAGRLRTGMTAAQPAGRLLGVLAGPQLAMAAVLAGAALLFGEWDPWFDRATSAPGPWGFGPFFTDGVPLYLLVVAAALAWTAGRGHIQAWIGVSRLLIVASFMAVAAIVVFEHISTRFGRPPAYLLGSMGLLSLPAILAPANDRRTAKAVGSGQRQLHRAATALVWVEAVGLASAGALQASRTVFPPASRIRVDPAVFYRLAAPEVLRWVPILAAAGLVTAVALTVRGRHEPGAGYAVLVAPWLTISAAALPYHSEASKWTYGLFALFGLYIVLGTGIALGTRTTHPTAPTVGP